MENLNNLTKEQLINRLNFIKEDSSNLRKLLNTSNGIGNFLHSHEEVNTTLSNIEIASDLNDNEPETQKWS